MKSVKQVIKLCIKIFPNNLFRKQSTNKIRSFIKLNTSNPSLVILQKNPKGMYCIVGCLSQIYKAGSMRHYGTKMARKHFFHSWKLFWLNVGLLCSLVMLWEKSECLGYQNIYPKHYHYLLPVTNNDGLVALHLRTKLHVVHQVPLASSVHRMRHLSLDNLTAKSES